jgi:RNA methyltransferase, TrmH family
LAVLVRGANESDWGERAIKGRAPQLIIHNSEFRTPRRITSSTNSLIKVFRRALKDGVTADGWLALEGRVVFEEILSAGPTHSPGRLLRSASWIRSVLISEGAAAKYESLLEQLSRDVEIAAAPERLFRSVARTVNSQGLAALVELCPPDLGAILAQRDVVIVVVCGLQDPGNLGTIARTAEAFGAGALLALRSTVSPFNPKAVSASAGAVFRLPVYAGLEGHQTFERLEAAGVRLAAGDPRGEIPVSGAELRGSVGILIGNEAAGVGGEALRHASLRLRIPVQPGVDSINAAVAAGILLYEVARQRGFEY